MTQAIYTKMVAAFLFIIFTIPIHSQNTENKVDYSEISLEEIRNLTQDDLLQIPFNDLIQLVKRFKVSSIDELYHLILNPVQTTASKTNEDLFDATLATTVITSLEIKNSGARSIPEALKLAPGIIVREKTNGNYDVHIRGNDFLPPGSDMSNSVNATTLVMIDNRPVYNKYLGATFWENLPVTIHDLDKIEIIYGPSTALYGPNAVSGVIHLITKKQNTEGIHVSSDVQLGNHQSATGYGNISYSKNNFNLYLSGNYQQADRFQDTYYIPMIDTYVSGSEARTINEELNNLFSASGFNDDYWMGIQKEAFNIGMNYKFSENTNLFYMSSVQQSTAQTSYMDIGSVLSTRKSDSFSNNLNFTSGKLGVNVSFLFGHLNAIEGMAGYEYDYSELNGQVGYLFNINNLNIRPGIQAEYANYSDEDYVDTKAKEGILNGSVNLGNIQGSLRVDYTAFKKLRLTCAAVSGYFTATEKDFTSYQFSSSYKINESTMIRGVASKANSGPFVLNTYADRETHLTDLEMDNIDYDEISLYRKGNKNLHPMEMSMLELGLRKKLGKKLQADLSVFYNKSDNYSQMIQDFEDISDAGTTALKITESAQNIKLKARQTGISISLKYVPNENFNFSIFGTYQKTDLNDFQITEASYYEGLTANSSEGIDLENDPVYISIDHEYTPSFYGGGYINYKPGKKWNMNVSYYAYSKQKTFYSVRQEFNWVEIDPKLNCNIKTSYQINDKLSTYLNLRNFTDNQSQEFLFTDETGLSCLVGINLTL